MWFDFNLLEPAGTLSVRSDWQNVRDAVLMSLARNQLRFKRKIGEGDYLVNLGLGSGMDSTAKKQ